MIVPPWVKPVALAAALCGAFGAGHHYASIKSDNKALRADAGRQDALNKAVEAERERADGYSRQVIALLEATPPVTNTVREVIRANPSACVRPEPVTLSLQSALSRANAAIAAAGSDGVVPSDASETRQPDR